MIEGWALGVIDVHQVVRQRVSAEPLTSASEVVR